MDKAGLTFWALNLRLGKSEDERGIYMQDPPHYWWELRTQSWPGRVFKEKYLLLEELFQMSRGSSKQQK